jgi:hypothetical protein
LVLADNSTSVAQDKLVVTSGSKPDARRQRKCLATLSALALIAAAYELTHDFDAADDLGHNPAFALRSRHAHHVMKGGVMLRRLRYSMKLSQQVRRCLIKSVSRPANSLIGVGRQLASRPR